MISKFCTKKSFKNVTFEVTYIIKNNTIIVFLFQEKAINDDQTEYTEITKYCILTKVKYMFYNKKLLMNCFINNTK